MNGKGEDFKFLCTENPSPDSSGNPFLFSLKRKD
jgi:hypothetical protein